MNQTRQTSAALDGVATLNELFAWRVRRTPRAEAYRQYDPAARRWHGYTWEQIALRVDGWCRAIGAQGLAHGARVAILLPNGIDAVCVDQAVLALGLVPVPMHALDNPASITYILNDAQVALAILQRHGQWSAIAADGLPLPWLKQVVLIEEQAGVGGAPGPGAPQLSCRQAWLAAAPAASVDVRAAASAKAGRVGRDDLAAIVYTSGTTGKPKGVMLSHHNVMVNLRAVLARIEAGPDDVFLSFLPLSHTFERTIGYYLPMAAGSCVAYARSVALLAEDLLAVRPTVLVSVPRIYERVYGALQERLAGAGPLACWLWSRTLLVGWRRFCRRQGLPVAGGPPAVLDMLAWPLLDALVARPVRARFGGRLRAAVSGGAPLSQAVGECFLGLGLPLLQGYGMTESSPVVAANTAADNWPATVGRALAGIEVRIGERDELQVRAESVMRGYWNRPGDTRAALTADGWLRTGDQAALTDGRIRIIGRIKDILVTSSGEKIAAVDVEQAILADALFEQAMVVGESRPYLAAVVVLSRAGWAGLAAQLGRDPLASGGANDAAVQAQLLERLRVATRALPRYATPRAVWVCGDVWTVENSLMTPTLKLKRAALQARYQGAIAGLYPDQLGDVAAA